MKRLVGILLVAFLTVGFGGTLLKTSIAEFPPPNSKTIAEFPPPNSIMYSVYQ